MSKPKKRLIIVSYRYPYPSFGGDKLRIHNIAKRMSSDYSVSLLCLTDIKAVARSLPCHPNIYEEIECIYLPKWRSYLNCVIALFTGVPLQVAYYNSGCFKAALDSKLRQSDVVLAHLVRTGHYLIGSETPKVLEMTDAISMNYERVKKSKNRSIKALIYSFEAKRLAKYERKMAAEFDLVSLVSAVDVEYLFGKKCPSNVMVTPLTLDVKKIAHNYNPDCRTIVFIGNLRTLPNLDAVKWFAQRVMPLLLQRGGYEFHVFGMVDEHEQKELNELSGVWIQGAVDNLSAAAGKAFVGVCPMRVGAGIQTKVLEYMAMGLPVVSSPLGAEGIGAKIDEDLLVANDESEFAEAIVRLANDDGLARTMSLNARKYVESAHDTDAAMKDMLERVNLILNDREMK